MKEYHSPTSRAPGLAISIAFLFCAGLYAQTGPGGALSFNGTNYVSIPNFGAITPTNEVTVELWTRVNAANSSFVFTLEPNDATNRFSSHAAHTGGYTYWDFGNIDSTGRVYYPTPAGVVGNWTHFAMVASQSGNFMRIYRNGVLETNHVGMTPFLPKNYELRIGGTTNFYFNGAVDEFRVWNTARAAEEIQTNMNRRLAGSETGLLLYYHFDEGAGTVASNSATATGSAYNGTLVNAPARILSGAAFDPSFTNINAAFTGLTSSSVSWGDYDNDGNLDILLTGLDLNSQPVAQVWRNNGNGTFTNINAGLTGVSGASSSVAWGDYDNDGRLDILLTGLVNGNVTPAVSHAAVWRNNGSGFVNINAGLPAVRNSSVAWGDFDNDGYLDIVLTGLGTNGPITQIWRNSGSGTFANINAGLTAVYNGSVAWGDYDNDGNLDVLLSGGFPPTGSVKITQIWRNNGNGVFTDINAELPGVNASSVAWGDYDNDGHLDILLTGAPASLTGNDKISQVWRNNGNETFTDINAGLPGVSQGSASWGDYDNDGDLDILLTGLSGTGSTRISQVWRSNGNGTFTDINAGLPGLQNSAGAWGDYDNDGDLDILLTGFGPGFATQLWRNELWETNTPPNPPAGLGNTAIGRDVSLTWNPTSDLQTPAAGLTYNLRLGTTPGGSNVVSPHAAANGFRRLPALGNAQQTLKKEMKNLPFGTYYWSVQAVDSAFAGSGFATEQRFELFPPEVQTLAANDLFSSGATLNGSANPRGRETRSWFEYGLTTKYGNVTPATNVGSDTNALSFSAFASLYPSLTYYYRAVASNVVAQVNGSNVSFTLPGPSQVTPVLSELSDLNCAQGGFAGIGFTLSPADLEVTVRANNSVLLPGGSMTVSGSGASRILGLTPDPNHSGFAEVTVTASDGTRSARRTFNLTVTPAAVDPQRFLHLTNTHPVSAEAWRFSVASIGAEFTNLAVEYRPALSPTNSWIPATNVTSVGANLFEVNTGPTQGQTGFYRVRGIQLLSAGLDSSDFTTDEGTTAGAVIVFNGTYTGTVNYSWTDEAGVTETNSLLVNGTTAVIPIPVTDDGTIGRLRYLTVRLDGGADYSLTGTLESRVTIEEDDAEWVGVLDTPNGFLSFELTLLRTNGNLMGEIKSKESGFFPTNVLTYVTFSSNAFTAFARDVPIPKLTGSPLFDKRSYMTVGLTAVNGPGQLNVRSKQVQGTATLFSTIPGRAQLDTEVAGTFVLLRPPTAPSTNEAPLYPAP